MRYLAIVLGLVFPLLACAQEDTAKYKEGEHYVVIAGAPEPAKSGKIDVTEFFWYGCGHCYNFEPLIKEWQENAPDDVNFIGSPAVWRDPMVPHAKIFYTAKSLDLSDQLHPVFFQHLHRSGNPTRALQTPEQIAKLVTDQGLDGEAFVKTMDSFAVNSQLQQAVARQKSAQITGTPEMTVAGYYRVSTSNAGGQKEMLQVVDFLVDKIRKERGQ